jgi:NADH dehydrogenase/NADH:ubiquinone oxidoreductase subunit G
VVEVTRGKWTWLTTSCDLPIREGLTIKTNTPAVIESRKTTIELLWARAPEAEALRIIAEELGVSKPRFSQNNDIGKCILCGLCVRVCDKLIGVSAISFANRGNQRRVRTPFNSSSESCIGCQACVAVCPTGHVLSVDKDNFRDLQTWKTKLDMAQCQSCGKAYIPVKQFESVKAKLPEQIPLEKICPVCVRSRTVQRLRTVQNL